MKQTKLWKYIDMNTDEELSLDVVFARINEMRKANLFTTLFEDDMDWSFDGINQFIHAAFAVNVLIMSTDPFADALSGEAMLRCMSMRPGDKFAVALNDDSRWLLKNVKAFTDVKVTSRRIQQTVNGEYEIITFEG